MPSNASFLEKSDAVFAVCMFFVDSIAGQQYQSVFSSASGTWQKISCSALVAFCSRIA